MGSQDVKFEQMGGWQRKHFSKVDNLLYVPLILLIISTLRVVEFCNFSKIFDNSIFIYEN